jgi:hypothetical protein
MILVFDCISIGAALIGLYYLLCGARTTATRDRIECVGTCALLALISGLALAVAFVGVIK